MNLVGNQKLVEPGAGGSNGLILEFPWEQARGLTPGEHVRMSFPDGQRVLARVIDRPSLPTRADGDKMLASVTFLLV
jgi:hypothetical protein